VTSGDKPALLLQDVNLRTIQKSDGTFTIQFIGIKSHRFVGLSCHLTLNFTAGGELYLSLPLCVENTLAKEWLSLNMNSTNMYVAKKNVPIKTILGVEVSLNETDSVLISVPDELVQGRVQLTEIIRTCSQPQTSIFIQTSELVWGSVPSTTQQ
jgi:hypothetical protein